MSNEQADSNEEHFAIAFRPSRIRDQVLWALDGDTLFRNNAPVANMSEVTGGRWSVLTQGGGVSLILKLDSADGSTDITVSGRQGSTDLMSMRDLSLEVLRRVGERSPEARFHTGGGKAMVWFIFVIGVILALTGMSAVVGFIALDRSISDRVIGIVIGLGVTAFGVMFGWGSQPWDHSRFLQSPAEATTTILGRWPTTP